MNKKLTTIIMPAVIALLCSLLAFTSLDKKFADFFQRFLKSTAEDQRIVMINVDDETVEQVGTYPLSRSVYADSLVVLKDLGLSQAVFDLSFIDKSLAKIDERYVNEDLTSLIQSSFEQLSGGILSADAVMNDILVSVSHITEDSDGVLADDIGFFGNTFMTLSFGTGSEPTDEQNQQLENLVSLKNVTAEKDRKTPSFKTVSPTIPEFIEKAECAGAVNGNPDSDGYLRRLHLLYKYNGNYYGQLIFVPLLERLGNPEIKVSDSKILLVNADLGNGTVKDLVIPRAEDGSVLLKYPKKVYDEYNSISLWNIYRLSLLEKYIAEATAEMDENGFFSLWNKENPFDLLNAYFYLRGELMNGEDAENGITFADYKLYRDQFWALIGEYFSEENKNAILSDSSLDSDSAEYIASVFEENGGLVSEYLSSFEKVQSQLENATGIFGAVSTSSTDHGLNQYEDRYPNTGSHYTLGNQILSGDFVDDSNALVGIAIALVICLCYSLISYKLSGTLRQIVFGISMIAATFVILLVLFLTTRVYLGFAVPFFSLLLTFVATTVNGFLTASKDKKFITSAFGQCLSPEVVKEIVANPSSFKLGGQKLEMTAIFTDIQKFSSFSELLTASQLVALLNYYLTKMSDIIMEERGTVDKYEGDAIIALVGAPVKMEDHASRAVAAAIKMKAAEKLMNKEILQIASGEKPAEMEDDLYDAFKIMVQNEKQIFTRIGINSGEMIAGYMGSENKKNYTMMGNNVNLASRLEGVNKQYSTGGILMSEATRSLLGDRFILRRLDRVRVVNVNNPIQLYEAMAENDGNHNNLTTYVSKWEKAMDLLEENQYEAALEGFKKLKEESPSDKVCGYYISLLEKFFTKGTYPKEADNFGVEYMPEDGVFRLLQK